MGQVRNDFDEVRVLPTADYVGIEPGRVLEIPDEDVYHWVAGGWTPLTRYPVPARLYPNHRGDELAYALAAPDEDDPSVIAVGTPEDAEPVDAEDQAAAGEDRQGEQAATAAAPTQTPAATAPTAAPTPAPAAAAPAPADAKEHTA